MASACFADRKSVVLVRDAYDKGGQASVGEEGGLIQSLECDVRNDSSVADGDDYLGPLDHFGGLVSE